MHELKSSNKITLSYLDDSESMIVIVNPALNFKQTLISYVLNIYTQVNVLSATSIARNIMQVTFQQYERVVCRYHTKD